MVFDFLIEVSNEAARKIGGIYTVIKSKSDQLVKKFGDNYIMVGLYESPKVKQEFQEEEMPVEFRECCAQLEAEGIKCHYGRWVDAANVRCILVDATNFIKRKTKVSYNSHNEDTTLNYIKHFLWERYKIDSLFMGWDFNENVGWSWACGRVIEKLLSAGEFKNKKVVVQFHEWITGAGLLYLKAHDVKAATIFTTHATSLGRSLMMNEKANLFEEILKGIAEKRRVDVHKAFEQKVEGKHLMEKVCAHEATVFTTVSDIMAREVEYMLDKKPDIITPNALDFSEVPKIEKVIEESKSVKDDVDNFLLSVFLPYYPLDLSKKRLLYLSGRYEVTNKGIDVYIKSLAELNSRMKQEKSDMTVFAFIFVPTHIKGPHNSTVKNLIIVDKMNDLIEEQEEETRAVIFSRLFGSEKKKSKDPDFINKIKKLYMSLAKDGSSPPICVYEFNYSHDQIMDMIKENGLGNTKEDRVKVIFYPTYLKPGDGFLNMGYNEVISAFDIGVFPSRYEPWGYTPVEAGANLNIAVTTDLAGFGKFVMEKIKDDKGRGVRVLKMEGKPIDDVVNQLADVFVEVSKVDDKMLMTLKRDARKIVEMSNWESQINNYISAYETASKRIWG